MTSDELTAAIDRIVSRWSMKHKPHTPSCPINAVLWAALISETDKCLGGPMGVLIDARNEPAPRQMLWGRWRYPIHLQED